MRRIPLKRGVLIKLNDNQTFRITGKPVGSGGGSLIYPAELCSENGNGFRYALKEAYPAYGAKRDQKTGSILPETERDIPRIGHAKEQLLHELETSRIYEHAFCIIPVRGGIGHASISQDGGSTFIQTENAYTYMDGLRGYGSSIERYVSDSDTGCLNLRTAL